MNRGTARNEAWVVSSMMAIKFFARTFHPELFSVVQTLVFEGKDRAISFRFELSKGIKNYQEERSYPYHIEFKADHHKTQVTECHALIAEQGVHSRVEVKTYYVFGHRTGMIALLRDASMAPRIQQ